MPRSCVGFAALFALPIAIAIAILRYRLYDIDRIISRTIAWAMISGVLVGAFVVLVVGLQATLAEVIEGETLAVAMSTLAACALFQPVRSRVQRAVDRRFDRARYDAQRTADAFAERLRDERRPRGAGGRAAATVVGAIRPVIRRDLARQPHARSRTDAPRQSHLPGRRAGRSPLERPRGVAHNRRTHPTPRADNARARAPGGFRDRHARSSQDVPAVHRRPVGRLGVRRDDRGREPGRRHRRRARPGLGPGGRGSRGRRGRGRVRDLGPHDAPDPQPRAAQDRGHPRRERRRARPPRVEPDGQADPAPRSTR